MMVLKKLFEYKKACCLFAAAILVALGSQASASIPAEQVYSYAKNLDYTALRYLGSSIDNEDNSGNTALCIALAKGDRRAYQTLLQYGANRNARCIARRALAQKRMALSSGGQTFMGMGATGWAVTGALLAGGIGIAAAAGGGGGSGGSSGGSGKPQCSGYQQVCSAGYHATEDTCQIGDQVLYKCEPDTCEGYVVSCPTGYHPNGEMCRAGDVVMHKCSRNTCSGYVEACPIGYEETGDTCVSGDVLLKKCRAQKCLGYNIGHNPLDDPDLHCTDTSSCLSGTEYRYKCNACERGWVSSDCSKPYQCGSNFKLACVEYDGWVPTGQICLSGDTEYLGCEPKDCTGFNISAGTDTEHCADLERCKSGDNPAKYKCTQCEEGYNFGPDGTCQLISILCQNDGYSLQECNINTQYVAETDYCPYETNIDDGNKHYHRCSRRQYTRNCTAFDPNADICTECREGWHNETCTMPDICPAEYTDEKCDREGWVLDDTCYNGDNPKYKCTPAQCGEDYKTECSITEYPTGKTCLSGDDTLVECKARQHATNCGEVDPLHDKCLNCISEEFILNASGYCITLNEECATEGFTSEACPTEQYISSKCPLSEEYHKCSRRQNTAQCTAFEPEADICTDCEAGYGVQNGKCVSNGSLCGTGFKTAACATLEYISEICDIDANYHKCTRRSNTTGCTEFEDYADRCTDCSSKYVLDEASGTCISTSSLCPGYSSYVSCQSSQYKVRCEYDTSLLKCISRTRLVSNCRYYANPEEDDGICQTCESGYTVSPDGRTCVEDSGGDTCGDEYSLEDVEGCSNYAHCASNYDKKKCTRCNTSRGFIKDPDDYGKCRCTSSTAQIIDDTCVEPTNCDDYSTNEVVGCLNYILCPTDSSKKKCNRCNTQNGFKYEPNADGTCSCSSSTAQIVNGVCVESCDDYSSANVPGCYKYDYCPSDSSKKKCNQCDTSKGFKYTPNADGSCACSSSTAQIIDGVCVEPETCDDYSTADVIGCYNYILCPTDSSKKKCNQCDTSKGFKYTPNADGSCACSSSTAQIIDGVCAEPGTCDDYSTADVTGCYKYSYCSTDTSKKKCDQCNTSKGFISAPNADGSCSCSSSTAQIVDGTCIEPSACDGYSTNDVLGCSIYEYCPTDSTKKKCTACNMYNGYYFSNGTCIFDSCQYNAMMNSWEVCESTISTNIMCTTDSGNTNPGYEGKAFCCPQGTHKVGTSCIVDDPDILPSVEDCPLNGYNQTGDCHNSQYKKFCSFYGDYGQPKMSPIYYKCIARTQTVEHCSQYDNPVDDNGICSTCEDNYNLVNNVCVAEETKMCPYEADSPNLEYCTHATECDDGSWKCDGCIPTTSHAEAGKPGECIINTTAYCLEAGYETTEALHCQTPTGTPCIADGTNYYNQCSSCQSGYDLIDGTCVQSGGETECPYTSSDDAIDHYCRTDMTVECSDHSWKCIGCEADSGYELVDGACVPSGGEQECPYTSSDDAIDHYCRTDMTVECSDHSWKCIGCEADSGYELVDGACVPSGGEQECPYTEQMASAYCAHNTQCNDGSWKCDACVPTTAHTEAGKPGECIINTTAYCLEAGYETTEALHCQKPTGTPCIADGTNYYNQCSSCQSGYDLIDGTCVEQEPTDCTGSQPTPSSFGGYCKTVGCVNGEWKCTECTDNNKAYNDENGECIANTASYCEAKGKTLSYMNCKTPNPETADCVVPGTPDTAYFSGCAECNSGEYDQIQKKCVDSGSDDNGCVANADDVVNCKTKTQLGCSDNKWRCETCKEGWVKDEATNVCSNCDTDKGYSEIDGTCKHTTNLEPISVTTGSVGFGSATETASLTNNSSIEANKKSGDFYGMQSKSGNLTNNGSITDTGPQSGSYRYGMYSQTGNLTNSDSGTITTEDMTATRIVGMSLNQGEAINNGTITLKNNRTTATGAGEGVIGIKAVDNGTVENTKDIIIEGNKFSYPSSQQINQQGAYGLYVKGTTTNSGSIQLKDNNGIAVGIYGANKSVTNSGSILIESSNNYLTAGIYTGSVNGNAVTNEKDGTITIKGGSKAYGMSATTAVNKGSISISGADTAYGLEGTANSGTISITDSPTAIGLKGGTNAEGGTITITGATTSAIGIENGDNNGNIEITNSNNPIGVQNGSNNGNIKLNKTSTGTMYGIYANAKGTYTNAEGKEIKIFSNGDAYGIYATGSDVKVVNAGIINITLMQGIGIYANGSTVTNTGTIKISTNDPYSCEGDACNTLPFIKLEGNATFVQGGMAKAPALRLASIGGMVVATDTSHFEIENEFSGDLVMSSEVVTDGFDDTYTVENMIDAGDVSGLNLLSQSALFDAELKNETDAVLTMKSFDEVVDNQSVADFLKQNYAAGNNEELFNLLKEKDSFVALNDAVNTLTAYDVFNRFNFEDMTMMRELNADVNNKLFTDKSDHLTTSGSIAPFYFESGMGSNARYALYNTRIGRKSVGLSLALSNVNSSDRHDNNSRKDETFQMSVPFGYNRYGFKFITAPRFGYAYGTYDRNGYNHTYDGTVEKRMMGLMNETRYPIDMGGWSLSPAAEFNMLGYHVKGHEDGAPFALNIKSQNNYSVEAGLGLYAHKNITLGTNHRLQMRAGVAAYHEFADPYTTELEMQGMSGSFKIRDERRKNQRAVVRAGFDYNFGSDFSLMGAIASYVDGTTHTNANLDLKYNF